LLTGLFLFVIHSREASPVPEDQPRLDRTSLARLGTELQAAHHRSASEPLTQQQRDLLLEWAVAEALQAAQHQALIRSRPKRSAAILPLPLDPPLPPQPIATAPRMTLDDDYPVVLLLYSPEQEGWYTGFWSAGRWRTRLCHEVEFRPTHWLPPMLKP